MITMNALVHDSELYVHLIVNSLRFIQTTNDYKGAIMYD